MAEGEEGPADVDMRFSQCRDIYEVACDNGVVRVYLYGKYLKYPPYLSK